MGQALGVLRSFGKKGYRPVEVILKILYPNLSPGTPDYANTLSQIESDLDVATANGLARKDFIDLPEASILCYQIV